MSSNQERIHEQQRTYRTIALALRKRGVTGEITNWTPLGEHYNEIAGEVSSEVGRVIGPGNRPMSADSTVADLIDALTN